MYFALEHFFEIRTNSNKNRFSKIFKDKGRKAEGRKAKMGCRRRSGRLRPCVVVNVQTETSAAWPEVAEGPNFPASCTGDILPRQSEIGSLRQPRRQILPGPEGQLGLTGSPGPDKGTEIVQLVAPPTCQPAKELMR